MISLKDIQAELDGYNMRLLESYANDGCRHRLLVEAYSNTDVAPRILVMGVIFVCVCAKSNNIDSREVLIFECVFSSDVLLNSIGESFECTK